MGSLSSACYSAELLLPPFEQKSGLCLQKLIRVPDAIKAEPVCVLHLHSCIRLLSLTLRFDEPVTWEDLKILLIPSFSILVDANISCVNTSVVQKVRKGSM